MINLVKSITKPEWKFWTKVLIATIILTSLSRVFIVLWTPEGYVPRGNAIQSFIDRYVYVSYIEQAREGNYLFQDLFTAKEESAPMLNVFWLGAGLFARATHLSANFVLEFLRILFIPLLLLAVYLFFAYFIENIFQRKLAFLLASLGGGLGVIFLPVFYMMEILSLPGKMTRNFPIDLDNAEAFIFSTNYYSAHFIFSTALFIFILLFSFLAIDKRKIIYAVPAGLLSLVLANFHPFTFVTVSFILFSYFTYLIWDYCRMSFLLQSSSFGQNFLKFFQHSRDYSSKIFKNSVSKSENFVTKAHSATIPFFNRKDAWFLFKYGLVLAFFALPSVLYHLSMFYMPWWQNQTWKSGTVTPFYLAIITGYGMILIFALYSLWLSYRKKLDIKKEKILLVWALSHIVLIFMPVSVQGRFLEGYGLVLVILASYPLALFLQKRKWMIAGKFYAAGMFIIFFGLSFLLLIFLDLKNIFLQGNLLYFKKDAEIAMQKLKAVSGRDSMVLADIYNSSMLPGIALRRVFVGHGVETINYDEKYKILRAFMASDDASYRQTVLKNNKIDYLFYDSTWEKNWAWDPDGEQYLEKIYDQGGYKIYKVK